MAAVDDNMVQESRPTGVGPGDRLQAARIQQGLSLEDVAARMHLSTSILEAIEENNFEEITAPIFVKGYLRAYARIVALDEDEMIQQYMDYYSEEDPPISSTGNVAPEISVTDVRIRWTTYLVIVVLAVLLSAWWWNKVREEEPAISLDAQPAVEQDENALAEVPGNEIQAASETQTESGESTVASMQPAEPQTQATSEPVDVADESASTSETDTAETAAAPDEPRADDSAAPTQVETSALQAETVEDLAVEEGQAAEVEGEQAEARPALPNTPSLIAPSGSDRMRIVVIADTWADIKDSSGYQLVYDLLRADQSLELTGAAPFSVFLGNGHGVEITINDEEFDFSSRIRNDNTARLKVGG